MPWLAGLATAAQPALDPNSPSRAQRSNPVTYDVDFSVVVTAPYKTELLRVWLPLPQSNEAQAITGRRLGSFPIGVEPKIAREPVHGNEFAYFEFKKPEGAQMLRHQFRARVFEERWNLDPAQVETVERWPDAFVANLRPQADAAANSQFQTVLGELVPKRQGPASDLFSVMSWVDREMKYDHVNCSLRADAHFAFTNRQGHCSDYHGLCATMARSLGYPTRVVYGINLFPKKLSVALQAGSLPAAVRLGQLRRLRNAAIGASDPSGQEPFSRKARRADCCR
jgi:transglutaminase-like putative cysteine protease